MQAMLDRNLHLFAFSLRPEVRELVVDRGMTLGKGADQYAAKEYDLSLVQQGRA